MKNVLFVTYYWPPAGGAVVNRMFRFYKYLPLFGWNPIILTIGNGVFPFVDESLEKEINPATKLVKTNGEYNQNSTLKLNPYGFTDINDHSIKTKIIKLLKYNLIPDNRFYWYPYAIKYAKKLIKSESIDLLFSTSPPQTNHLICASLAKKFGIRWVADLRDPWTDTFWLQNENLRFSLVHQIDKVIEAKTLRKASCITTVTPDLVELIESKGHENVELIYNGYDPDYFDNSMGAVTSNSQEDKFVITYAGSMSYNHRPIGLFQNINIIRNRYSNEYKRLLIRFIGTFPPFLKELVDKYDLNDIVQFIPYMAMNDVIQKLKNADLLLVNGLNDINHGAIPSKLFDCIGARVPILAYGLDEDAQFVLRKSNAGRNFDFFDENESADYIIGIMKGEISYEFDHSEQFSRKAQTQQLAQIFDDVWSRRHH